ncbi:hypothetical protein BT96DRAFT_1027109, partial [Gymnopus androsaceus JB14]
MSSIRNFPFRVLQKTSYVTLADDFKPLAQEGRDVEKLSGTMEWQATPLDPEEALG